MAERFDCNVCADTLPASKRLACPSCQFDVCAGCQKTYGEGTCMNCRMRFTRVFLVQHLGVTFVNGPLKKKEQARLLEREKALLFESQPLVEWERLRRHADAQKRFNVYIRVPPKPRPGEAFVMADHLPAASSSAAASAPAAPSRQSASVFPCPYSDCRGFASGGECGICHRSVCTECRESLAPGHQCNPDVLKSVQAILADSRPCPRCRTLIHRISGCNHMHCLNCGIHWDWQTGKALHQSTNGHYFQHAMLVARDIAAAVPMLDNVEYADAPARAPRPTPPRAPQPQPILNCDEQDIMHDSVLMMPTDAVMANALYKAPSTVRALKQSMFNEREIDVKADDALAQLRVQYLLQEVDEAKWMSRIYVIEKARQRERLIADILALYLRTIRDLQYIYHVDQCTARIKEQLAPFLVLINDSLRLVSDEYGGTCPTFNTDVDNIRAPAFVL